MTTTTKKQGRHSLSILETTFLYISSSSSEEDLRSPLKKNSIQHRREHADDEKSRHALRSTKSLRGPSFEIPEELIESSDLIQSSTSSVATCTDTLSRFLRTPLSCKAQRKSRHSTCASQLQDIRNLQMSNEIEEHNDDGPLNTTFCYTPSERQDRRTSSDREERNNETASSHDSSVSSVNRKLNLTSSKSKPSFNLNSIREHLTPKRPAKISTRRKSAIPSVSLATTSSAPSFSKSFNKSDSLESVLADPEGKSNFYEFLKKEFSEENLQFWDDVQELKVTNGRSKIKQKVKEIYLAYIIEEAPKMLNLTMPVRLTVASNVIKNPGDKDCFSQAEESIFILMSTDSFRRFMSSFF